MSGGSREGRGIVGGKGTERGGSANGILFKLGKSNRRQKQSAIQSGVQGTSCKKSRENVFSGSEQREMRTKGGRESQFKPLSKRGKSKESGLKDTIYP